MAERRRQIGLEQVELAAGMGAGYSRSAIANIETGRRGLSLERATDAAQALGVSLDWLVGLTDDPTPADQRLSPSEVTDLPGAAWLIAPYARDVRAAAGAGVEPWHEAADCGVALHRSVLPSWARAEGLICIRATGNSMEPDIHDGDLVVLDRTSAEPVDGQTFVLRIDDGLIVKRLRRRGAAWEITSDNRRYGPRGVAAEDRVIGRVAWSGPRRG